MARIMALDVGTRRIGVAVCDDSESFVFPRRTLVRHEGVRRDMAALQSLIETEAIDEIVVGLPLNMDGTRGFQVENIERFAEALRSFTSLPIHFEDERLSTFEAEEMLREAGRTRQERRKNIDSVAAVVILTAFLERRRKSLEA